MATIAFDQVEPDMQLPSITRHVDQRVITRNATASLDYNPIHVDPVWAKKVNLLGKGTTIAHGMCTFSFMTSVITDWCYSNGGFISRMESKFIVPVRPGDIITCKGVVTEKHPRRSTKSFVVVELTAENQNNEIVAVAKATVTLPSA
ncbi:MAG: MaoC family dehydratase [Deltaproteobacteria bacterium]|nr:MaoC family dehydratase [Deltaproteobacteria bacterium]MBW1847015.1 MaoC family dehydratase [Deltaproteobacteria bacterium]MBW2179939.1 MaoC family dehydratase [Deltaproteobacteria bacterium]MBW2363687.1 MaoC family dehydratase [Deltaproteobacteria bacterium]